MKTYATFIVGSTEEKFAVIKIMESNGFQISSLKEHIDYSYSIHQQNRVEITIQFFR